MCAAMLSETYSKEIDFALITLMAKPLTDEDHQLPVVPSMIMDLSVDEKEAILQDLQYVALLPDQEKEELQLKFQALASDAEDEELQGDIWTKVR
jgi:hypothetical protein